MKRILDDEKWAPGRDAIEREKSAARAWLTKRDGVVIPTVRARRLRHQAGRRLGWIAAASSVLVLSAILFVKWGGSSRPLKRAGSMPGFLTVLEAVQGEGAAFDAGESHFGRAESTDFAWSVQQVLCRARITDEKSETLTSLIEKSLRWARAEDESRSRSIPDILARPTGFSELFSKIYKSIWEG